MNINGYNTSSLIEDGIITNSTTNGSFNIKCDDNTTYDLQTPDNGDVGEVLTTDGNGNTYWSEGGGGGNPFDQDLNTNNEVIFNKVSSYNDTGILNFTDIYPKVYADLNIGTQNTDYLRLGANGIFIENGNINSVNNLTANSFVKTAGTNQQYLMADGSSLQYSANSGNSNFYLYNNVNNTMTPPPANGQVGYNNATQQNATIIYISHRTRDLIDIDIFLAQLSTIQDVYLQDQENSVNYIKYNITATPTIIPNNYISIPVSFINGAGTGLTNFGVNHNILVSFFTNSIEVDTRLSAVETTANNALPKAGGIMTGDITLGTNNITGTTGLIQGFNIPTLNTNITTLQTKTQNQTAIPQITTFLGDTVFNAGFFNQKIVVEFGIYANTILSYVNNTLHDLIISTTGLVVSNRVVCDSFVKPSGTSTQFLKANGTVDSTAYLPKAGGTMTGELSVGTSQTPNEIFNNGSSLTKNNFNTSQSVGPIGFKDNWATASGNNASIKQGMIYMSNVGRVVVASSIGAQYFDDATGTLINITNGLTSSGSFLYIPSLGKAYSKNTTQYSTSVDGINWTVPVNLVNGGTIAAAIVYGNGLYVCASGPAGSLIQTSTDGITWTNRTATLNILNIIYTGTRFITFGSGGCMYSLDGITWVNDTIQTNSIKAAIYCDTIGCILAQIQGGNRNIIRSYDSGLTWTTLTNVFPISTQSNKMIWDSGSGKAYYMTDDGLTPQNSYLWEFDATGNPALGGSIKMMGNTSTTTSSGLTHCIYNPLIKRFYFTRIFIGAPVFYSTTSNNLAVSGNQYIIGTLNCGADIVLGTNNITGTTGLIQGYNIPTLNTNITTLQTQTQNQTATFNSTTYRGVQNFKSPTTSSYNQNLRIDSGSLLNYIYSYAYDETQLCTLGISATQTNFTGIVNCNNGLTTSSININNAYTLPTTAPAIGSVLTCGVLGTSDWIIPSPTPYTFIYPYPTALKTTGGVAATRTYCVTYTMTANFTFSLASIYFPTQGSDTTRVGIYRGDLTTATLVGQTANTAVASNYYTRAITVIAGQSLTFTAGQQVVVCYTQNGSTSNNLNATGISNIALATSSSNGYASSTFPTLISGIAGQTATTVRMCIDIN